MKKLFFLVAIALSFSLMTTPVNAAKPSDSCQTIKDGSIIDSAGIPVSLGYDQFGYNYQAHMFNGWYDNYSRPSEVVEGGDRLMMKWNDAWLSNKDCTGDGKLDRHFGYLTYRDSGAWLTNHASGTYLSETASSWDVSGTWLLDFAGGSDNREFRDLVQDGEGNVVGEFWWFNSSTWQYGGTLVGNISGNVLSLHYDRSPAYIYTGDFKGVVGETGITDGTFSDSNGGSYTWTATGAAVGVYDTCTWSDFVKIVAAPADATLVSGNWISIGGGEIGPAIWGEFAIIQEVSEDSCGEMDLENYKSPLRAGLGNW